MKKTKPIIAAKRPFWRNPLFPWGWYSITSDDLKGQKQIKVDGYYKPGDGCEQTYIFVED